MGLLLLENELRDDERTKILVDDESVEYGTPHHFMVTSPKADENNEFQVLTDIVFQKGPVREVGVNGCSNEDLLSIVLCRLMNLQDTVYACKENDKAIEKIEEALLWLHKRTELRKRANVEGTSKFAGNEYIIQAQQAVPSPDQEEFQTEITE